MAKAFGTIQMKIHPTLGEFAERLGGLKAVAFS